MEDPPDLTEISEQGESENGTVDVADNAISIGDSTTDVEGDSTTDTATAAGTAAGTAADIVEYDPMLVLELGDRVLIDRTHYGRTVGHIYYRDGELIRVLPDGASDRLIDFPRIYTTEEDKFDDELGVEASYVLEKRKFDSFVEQHDIRVGQQLETITKSGEMGPTYEVESVMPEDDAIIVKDETGTTQTIEFGYIGVPLDLPFVILRKQIGAPDATEGKEQATPIEAIKDITGIEDIEEVLEKPKFRIRASGFAELPSVTVYREARTADKIYTDTIQKVDALNDFLNMLDPITQKDPKSIRIIRLLVETLFQMKQSLIAYNTDGSIRGTHDISVQSIGQLLEKVDVPMGRAVIDIAKRVYLSPEDEELETLPTSDSTSDYFYKSFLLELEQMNRSIGNITSCSCGSGSRGSSSSSSSSSSSIVAYWFNEQSFMNSFGKPWVANSVNPPKLVPKSDVDIFRRYIPDLEDDQIPGGFVPSLEAKQSVNYPIPVNIKISMQRALGATYRKGVDKRKQELLPAEVATMKSYLLFPLETANQLGTVRSGSLALDSGRSLHHIRTMLDIFKGLGGVQDVATAKGIIAVGATGNTFGNTPLKDYIEGIRIPGTGFGDADQTLIELGLDKLEMTPEILQVLNSKFTAYQNQLLSTLAKLREEIAELSEPEEPVIKMKFLEDPQILEIIRTEPALVNDLVTFEKQNPLLAKSDIAQVVYLLRKHADYFQAAAGQQSVFTAREKHRVARDMFLESLKIATLLRLKRDERGDRPEPNMCAHVAKLRTIRKIHDDMERYQVLTKFFAKYQGKREDNWIMCNLCDKGLLCVHERIQIQAYLSPKEKDQLQKEIILNFADGVFQGNYICRNCGQPIQELGYDTHMEYDDNGRPMAGRAVLVDKDAVRKEEIDAIIGIPLGTVPDIAFDTDAEAAYYQVIKEIAGRVGTTLDKAAYRRIISRIQAFMSTLQDRKSYSISQKGAKGKADYDVIISRNTIAASALFLLVEIQTRIPDYVVRYALPGCVASFAGFPLGQDTDRRGLIYLACATATINRNEAPWNTSGFLSVQNDEKRREAIQRYMESILTEVLKSDITFQQGLQDKRSYIKDTFGAESVLERSADEIPHGFLPDQVIVKPTDAPIIPEVAAVFANRENATSENAISKAWIIHGHHLAHKTATLIKGSPFIETTCCLTNIQTPGSFWDSVSDLPKLPLRKLQPSLLSQSIIKVHFDPRKQETVLVETPEDLMYRIFLKVCFQGPRKGMPHEPGLTHLCPWCGLQFPGHPSYIDTDVEGKSALLSQGVDTGATEFQSLIDEVHVVNKVPTYAVPPSISMDQVMTELATMDPPPMNDWTSLLEETLRNFKALVPDANVGDMIVALGPLSNAIAESEEVAKRRLPEKARNNLDALALLSWTNFFQIIHSYFTIPFQRMLNGLGTGTKVVPPELELSQDHVLDIKKIFGIDEEVIKPFMAELTKANTSLAVAKLTRFLKQISKITEFKSRVRAIMLPGRARTLNYIQRAFLYGPLADLIDPNVVPDEVVDALGADSAVSDRSIKLLLNLVTVSLGKAMKERMAFSDEELRVMITARNEKEKMNIIKGFEGMTDDERAVEMMNKFIGLGKWAVGGTKVIYAYDQNRYDYEKKEREQAGISDFPGLGPDELVPQDGAPHDEYGLPVVGEDQNYIRDNGYDNAEADDDAY